MAYTGDRRGHVRFQIVGQMPASLMASEPLTVLNLGIHGALVEGALPLTEDGEYRMQLVIEGFVGEALVKIRRVTTVPRVPGGARYQMGVEFLDITPEARAVIHDIVIANGAHA